MTRIRLLVCDVETGGAEEIGLSAESQELLELQMAHCAEAGGSDAFLQWIGAAISGSLSSTVAYQLRPPSAAQVGYATAIARTLGLAIAPQVIRYRGHMHEFLSSHADEFKCRQFPVRTPRS